jgi:hypothetical protein
VKIRVFIDSAKLNKLFLAKMRSKTGHFQDYTAHSEKKLNYTFLENMQSETKHFCRKRKVELYVFGDNVVFKEI